MFRKILFFLLLSTVSVSAQDNSDPGPTCFDISILPENNPYYLENKDQYVVCADQKVTITPTLNAPLRRTNMYDVEQIPYSPYPFDGTEINIAVVDQRGDDLTLPFKFCYFDQTYDLISVHSNGYISFTDGVSHKVQYPDVGNDPSQAIPMTDSGLTNAVMLQKHAHYATGQSQGRLFYAVYGEAPCRVFVVTYYNMLAYQLNPAFCPPTVVNGQTSQIVFHETTNFIDIIAVQHNSCPLQDIGRSVMGINNATGTQGYAPPGRNLGLFDAVQEAWRFTPSGELQYRLEWEVNGVVVSNSNAPLELVIDEQKIVTAKLISETCDEEHIDKYEVRFRPPIVLSEIELDRLIVCDKNQNSYDLNVLSQMIKDSQKGVDPVELDKLKFLYYPTENDAIDKTNQIRSPRDYPINMGENELYVRIETEIADCFEIAKAVIIKAPVEVKTPTNVNLCTEYILPVLTDDEFYSKLERLDEDGKFVVETLPQPTEEQLINKVGYYKVSVKKTNEYACEDVKSFILFVENCSYPKGISPNGDGNNDYLDLTYNNVVELKIFNRYGKVVFEHGKGYKRQWHGQDMNGKILPSGTYFLNVKTKDYEYQDWIQLMYELK